MLSIFWHTIAMARPRRGPCRSAGSHVKLKCTFKQCRSKRDVKTVGADLRLRPDQANLQICRKVRSHCASLSVCCQTHVQRCRATGRPKAADARGGREALDVPQLAYLIQELIKEGPIWPAVLLLVQPLLGERADAGRHAKVHWFQNCSP